ncbi:hypothetical protein FA13DRAFT_492444 [Coprinellus micaceus]|uniref:Uncharacterized protein n=1 Tax=Coprinellus micaceus TaxID=71717 RepID=A0A4Y7TAX0_COPMI|nr:hypothetical protein FA13DRAFT_492444 [Coprinellus micaceus]
MPLSAPPAARSVDWTAVPETLEPEKSCAEEILPTARHQGSICQRKRLQRRTWVAIMHSNSVDDSLKELHRYKCC